MGNKFIDVLIWAVGIAILLSILYLLIEPIVRWTRYSEMRLCVRLFLLMFAVNTFAVLRLYNSIVQNTRFSLRLREVLIRFTNSIPGLERSLRVLSNSMISTKGSVDSLKKELSDILCSVEKFMDKINRVNNKK